MINKAILLGAFCFALVVGAVAYDIPRVFGQLQQINITPGAQTEILGDGTATFDISTRATDGGPIHIRSRSGGTGIFISTGNNVGIGTTSPGSLLHVNGTFQLQTGTSVNTISTSTALGTSNDALATQGAIKAYVDAEVAGAGGAGGSNQWDGPDDTTSAIGRTGNVGIGILNPSSATILHVGSQSDSTTSTQRLRVESRGFAALELFGDTDNTSGEPGGAYVLYSQDGEIVEFIGGSVQNAGENPMGNPFTGTSSNSFLLASHDGRSDDIHIGSGGNVELTVGTSGLSLRSGTSVNTISTSTSLGTSNDALATQGAIKAYVDAEVAGAGGGGSNQWDGLDDTTSAIGRTGNVGIGTTSPQTKLDVDGNLGINITSSTGIQSELVSRQTSNPISGSRIVLSNLAGDFRQNSASTGWGSGIKFTVGDSSSYTGTAAIVAERTGSWSQGKLHFAVNDSGTSGKADIPILMTLDGPGGSVDINGDLNITGTCTGCGGGGGGGNDYWSGTESTSSTIGRTGNVGIGTTSPLEKLHVSGDMRVDGIYRISSSTGNGAGIITTGGQGGTSESVDIMSNRGSGTLRFFTNAGGGTSEVMRIANDGNVGIGTTSPGRKLDVDGWIRLSGPIERTSGYIDLRPTDSTHGIIIRDYTGGSTSWSGIRANTNGRLEMTATGGSGDYSNLVIDTTGNVGIGTTSPSERLHVTGNIRSNTGFCISTDCITAWPSGGGGGNDYWSGTASTSSAIGRTGNVGIGTTSPNSRLHVNGESGSVALRVQVGGGSRLTVASNGGVSIGAFQDSPPSNGLYVSGNVGIGTWNPLEKLHVAGRVRGSALCIETDCRSSWPSGGGGDGTVTSVSAGTGLSASPNPITSTGTISADTSYLQRRVSSSCSTGSAIRVISSTGGVTCQSTGGGGNDYWSGTASTSSTIGRTGDVGIGTTSPGRKLHVADSSSTYIAVSKTSSTTSTMLLGAQGGVTAIYSRATHDSSTAVPLRIMMGSTERLRILGNGRVGIGTSSPDYDLEVIGTSRTSGGAYANFFLGATGLSSNNWIEFGNTSTASAGLCYATIGSRYDLRRCSSLAKEKTNVDHLGVGLDTIMQLRPVEYDWIRNGERDLGFIAEEVEAINPLLAEYSDGELASVKYRHMVALLTKGMQEQQEQIEGQQKQIDELREMVIKLSE